MSSFVNGATPTCLIELLPELVKGKQVEFPTPAFPFKGCLSLGDTGNCKCSENGIRPYNPLGSTHCTQNCALVYVFKIEVMDGGQEEELWGSHSELPLGGSVAFLPLCK